MKREMVLNHVSLVAYNRHEATHLLKDVMAGISLLISNNAVKNNLRMSKEWPQIQQLIEPNGFLDPSSYNYQEAKDSIKLLLKLSAQYPLDKNLEATYKERFSNCEYLSHSTQNQVKLPPDDGAPLILCVVTDSIAVGFSSKNWDCEQIKVNFNELYEDSSVEQVSETIDNLTQARHANSICESHLELLQVNLNQRDFWAMKCSVFQFLKFGLDVEQHIQDLPKQEFPTVIKRLKALNETCEEWRVKKSSLPEFKCRVSPEGENVRTNPKLRERRSFLSAEGSKEFFEWHARFGNVGRIHFRLCKVTQSIEIGYIGPHLPTKKSK